MAPYPNLLFAVCCLLLCGTQNDNSSGWQRDWRWERLSPYSDAHDEDGTFVPRFFFFMESLVLIIIVSLFYIYSRKKG